MCLFAPRFVEHDGGNGALSGASKSLQIRAQSLDVAVAPTLHVVVAAHGVGLLPEVQVELLVLHLRKRACIHVYGQCQSLQHLSTLVHHFQSGLVFPCLGIAWYFQRAPHGACLHGGNGMRLVLVNHIGHQPCLQTAGMVAASLEVVGDDVVHEACLAGLYAGLFATLCPFCHAY